MKTISKLYILPLFAFVLMMGVGFTSCGDDLPKSVESPDLTEITGAKMIVESAGNLTVTGKVDEFNKLIRFPRFDADTDFSKVKFELTTKGGGTLAEEYYNFAFAEGEDSKIIPVKLINNKRFREYNVQVRILVPLYGADFERAKVYDFSANPAPYGVWPSFSGLLTRSAGFDGKWVAVPSRGTAHVISVDEILTGVEPKEIPLNLQGVSGGTFVLNGASVVNGHIYMCALGGTAIPNTYMWTDPTKPPVMISQGIVNPTGISSRLGDTFNLDLDEDGNGYAYYGENNGSGFVRVAITNYSQMGDAIRIASPAALGTWSFFTHIAGTNNYLITSLQHGTVYKSDGGAGYSTAIPAGILRPNAGDPRVIDFNGERYLLVTNGVREAAHGSTSITVYNITDGANALEALQKVSTSGNIVQLFDWPLGGTSNAAPGTRAAYKVIKDEAGKDKTLLLFGAVADSGFAIIEVPIKEILPDDF